MSKKPPFLEIQNYENKIVLIALSQIVAIEEIQDNVQRIITVSGKEYDSVAVGIDQIADSLDVITME